jgi:hypothetical protein
MIIWKFGNWKIWKCGIREWGKWDCSDCPCGCPKRDGEKIASGFQIHWSEVCGK